MAPEKFDFWLWMRWPLVPIFFAVGCIFIAGLVVLQILMLPWLVLYPEYHAHAYDFGDPRQQEAVRRWRSACRRVSFWSRLKRILAPRSF